MDISSSDHPSCTPPNETASSVEASVIDDMAVGTGVGTVIRMLTTLTAKYGKERIILSNLDSHGTDIGKVKQLLYEQTNILPKRQKLIGLVIDKTYKASRSTSVSSSVSVSSKMLSDDLLLCHLQVKPKDIKFDTINNTNIQHNQHSFILMGTPEVQIQKLTSDNHNHNNNNSTNNNNNNNNNQVINDFDLEFNAGSIEWLNHFANDLNLQKFTNSTQIHIMNPPRMGKPLMVLDLDHTLLDFSSKTIMNTNTASSSTSTTNNNTNNTAATANNSNNPSSSISNAINIHEKIQKMKRPFMDEFLSIAYQHYDLCVWSQTSWRWLETKLVELNMVHNPNYKFCFVLDKTSMFAISANNNNNNNNNNNIPENASIANNTSNNKKYKKEKHYVKPLQIIWSKYPQYWNETNTIHLDDLGRNFALNIQNGLKVSAYYRKKSKGSGSSGTQKDVELVGLARYCAKLAMEVKDFTCVDFNYWKDVVNGTRQLVSTSSNSKSGNGGGGGGGSKKNDNGGGKGGNGNGMEKQP